MALTHLFTGVPVADLAEGLAFYEQLFGRAPDMVPNANEACWQVADGGWIYVVGDDVRAGGALVTILMDDIERFAADLRSRGIDCPDPAPMPGIALKFDLEDPEGNSLQFAQPAVG